MPNVRLPNGMEVWVDDIAALGSTAVAKTADEDRADTTEATTAAVYDTAGQKALAFGEGALSGLTFGLSDLATDDNATRQRAKRNSGYRTAGEITGLVVPAVLTGGSSLAARGAGLTAGGLGAKLGVKAGLAAERAGGGALVRAITAGAVENTVAGVGGIVSKAALSDDPLTVQSALADLGLAGLLGAGGGAVGHGLGKLGARAQGALDAPRLAEEAAAASEARIVGAHADSVAAATARNAQVTEEAVAAGARQAGGHAEAVAFATAHNDRVAAAAGVMASDDGKQLLARLGKDLLGARGVVKADIAAGQAAADALHAGAVAAHAAENATANAAYKTARDANRYLAPDALAAGAASAKARQALFRQAGATKATAEYKALRAFARKIEVNLDPALESTMLANIAKAAKDVDAADMVAQRLGRLRTALEEANAARPVLASLGEKPLSLPASGFVEDYNAARARLTEARAAEAALPPRGIPQRPGATAPPVRPRFSPTEDQAQLLDLLGDRTENALKSPRALVNAHTETLATLDATIKALGPKGTSAARSVADLSAHYGYTGDGGLVGLKSYLGDVNKLANQAKRTIPKAPGALPRPTLEPMPKAPKAAADVAEEAPTRGSWARSRLGRYAAYKVAGPLGGALYSSAMLGTAKVALKRMAQRVAATAFGPAGKAIVRAMPVITRYRTEYAPGSTAHPRDLIRSHMLDIAATKLNAPDLAYTALEPVIGQGSGRFAAAAQRQAMLAADAVYNLMPKDPGTAMLGSKSGWTPSESAVHDVMEARLAVDFPHETIAEGIASGRPSQLQSTVLWQVYPAVMAEYQSAFLESMSEGRTVPYERRAAVAAFFRVPYDGLYSKENVAAFAALYAEVSPPPGESTGAGGQPPEPRGTGSPNPVDQKTQVQRLTN